MKMLFLRILLNLLPCLIISGLENRIIGGFQANIRAYPYVAAVNVQTSNSRHFCGGALLGSEWIITAGQCVDGAVLFTISLGSAALEGEDPNRVTVATSTYYLHPDYNPDTLDNDIGLIKLRMPVTHTDYLGSFGYIGTVTMGVQIYALGWGQTSDSDSSLASRLQVAHIRPITNEECKITYGNQITENMVCIAGNYNEGICHGDTGSPLIEITRNGLAGHVGIASFISGNGCETPDPSGFTRTHPYVEWIREITGEEFNSTVVVQ